MGKQHFGGRRAKKNPAGVAVAALAVSLVLLVVLVSTAVGRYQHELSSEGSVRAKEFYFTSDFLDGKTHTLAPGSTRLSFTLGNHADELRFSEVDVAYDVTVTPADGVTVENSRGTLTKNARSDSTVTIKGLQPGNTYTVTATGTGGYSKTLTATINVLPGGGKLYYHLETGEYTLLTVWNEGNEDGTVTITYTGIPDNTNPNMRDWLTNAARTVQIKAHESRVFRFFDAAAVTVTDAIKKTPG